MALYDTTHVQRQVSIFSSVFPRPINPPRIRTASTTTPDSQHLLAQAKRSIGHDTRVALGVDQLTVTLTFEASSHAFRSHFESCPPMSHVISPSQRDLDNYRRKVLPLPAVRDIPEWVGKIGRDNVEKVFAQVINECVAEFIKFAYGGVYAEHEEVVAHLAWWVRNVFLVFVKFMLGLIRRENGTVTETADLVSEEEVRRWTDKARTKLALLRVEELFQIVVEWPRTESGIDDLKPFVKPANTEARRYVTERFGEALQTRLLHPGASSMEILTVYLNIIRAFRRLDPRGVLLERVVVKLRRYLKDRDDTVKIVVEGLLSDITDIENRKNSGDMLTDLAYELHNPQTSKPNTHSVDWNDMNWTPAPMDAIPYDPIDVKTAPSNRYTDIIHSVISLFESKDIFVKELQSSLAERLLRTKDDYEQETIVIEHLKLRFGESSMQSCEVMLKDIFDSKRLDDRIRKDQQLDAAHMRKSMGNELEPELHAKILSRLFWPTLPAAVTANAEADDAPAFKPPITIAHQRHQYETGFEQLKQQRKLTWNDNLGQVELELSFADGRTFHGNVLPYQAAVIYVFHDDGPEDSARTSPRKKRKPEFTKVEGVTRTVKDISEEINLNPILVRSACLLFVSKQILVPHASQPDAFTVHEYLHTSSTTTELDSNTGANKTDLAAEAAALKTARDAEVAAAQALKDAEEQERHAKLQIYHQFVISMLTNGGQMPLARISMMLNMVVPGGFPYGTEELKSLLEGMMKEGTIGVGVGGNWKITPK